MLAAVPNHIRISEDGTCWLDDTNVKVVEVVLSYLAADGRVDWLAENHPHLTPARIHAAMAWYYDHKEDFDRQIAADDRKAAAWAAAGAESPLVRRLHAAREARG